MSWIGGRVARVRALFARRGVESRMREEFAFHIEQATAAHVRAGLPPAEARRRALLEFGGAERHGERMRDGWRLVWLDDLASDVRFAVRWLRRTPGFAATAVLTIALGVGATTALFSVTNALLLRSLPVHEPERLYSIQEERSGQISDGIEGMQVSHARYESYVEASAPLFTGVAGHAMTQFALRTDGAARPASGVLVSGNYFSVLGGVRPLHGRLFGATDEPVIVLGYRFWQARFGGDPGVVGRVVHVDGHALTVAGVMAREFTGTNAGFSADVWVPYGAATRAGESAWAGTWLTPFGRLRPGVDARAAAAELPAIAQRIDFGAAGVEVEGALLEPLTGMRPDVRPLAALFFGLLLAMATLVLLIAAANIAGMQLGRALRRRREVAIRLALGAGRGRLVRQLLTESMVLFLLGGVAGVALAWWATGVVARITVPIELPLLLEFGPDLRVLAFGLAAAALAGIAFGLLPALRASRPELTTALKDGASPGGGRGGRARGVFVAGQVALAVVLVVVAGLFTRTLQRALDIDSGFDTAGIVVASYDLSMQEYDEERGRAFHTALHERVSAMGDVESAALARVALLTGSSVGVSLAPADAPEATLTVSINEVDAAYFATLGISIVAGRGFDEHAGAGAARTVVVNETLARRFWPDAPPLGQRLRRGNIEYEVVGVTRDGLYRDFNEAALPFAFFPRAHFHIPGAVLHVRTRTPPAEMIERIRGEVMRLDADVALDQAAPLAALVGTMLLPQRVAAWLVGVFGALGLVLAGIGIYGVLAYHVSARTRELGIRVALGASARHVTRLVVGGVSMLTALGALIGIALAAALAQLIRSLLFGISAHDPVTFIGVPLLLIAVALLASYFPVRRALRADPVRALRQD